MTCRVSFQLVVGIVVLFQCVTGIQKSVVAVFEDNSCSEPAVSVTLTSSLTCTPQLNHYEPLCESGGELYFVSDCTNYYSQGYDEIGIINDAMGNYPYLGVEKFTEGYCGSSEYRTSVVTYRLDEKCYSNAAGTASHRLTLDHSAIITTYSDAQCTNVTSKSTVKQSAMGWGRYGRCIDDNVTVPFYGNPPNGTVVVVYGDNTCSSVPTQIKFSQDFICKVPVDATCQDEGSSRYSISSCTGDLASFAADKFGKNNPYVIKQDYPDPWCNGMEYATVFSADGLCHTNTDGETSFRVKINAANSTTSITIYSDSRCVDVASDTKVDSGVLSSSACVSRSCSANNAYGCSVRYAVGGLNGSPSVAKQLAVVIYGGDACEKAPIQVIISKTVACAPLVSACNPILAGITGVFESRECVDNYDTFVVDKYGYNPYLVVERYVIGTNCQDLDTVTIYAADGKCHPSANDGTYFTVTQRIDGAVVIATYPTWTCVDTEAVVSIVGSWYINTESCYEGKTILRTSKAPLAATPKASQYSTPTSTSTTPSCVPLPVPSSVTPTPTPTPEAPVDRSVDPPLLEIMFPDWLWDPTPPRVFESDGRRQPSPHHRYP